MRRVTKAVVGCEAGAWGSAMPAAVALVMVGCRWGCVGVEVGVDGVEV